MNKYEELVYSLIYNSLREVSDDEIEMLNQAAAIYNTYNRLTELLGFSLDIAFRALKDGIYVEQGQFPYTSFEKHNVRGIELRGLGVINNLCPYGECDFTCEYKDYKKTWWLREDKSE